MSMITDVVSQLRSRLLEVERQRDSLEREAAQLREALAKLEEIPEPGANATAPRRKGRAARAPKKPRRSSNGRAPRGQNRQRILAAIATEAKTAGQIAKETGISRATAATTLTKLVADGAATKAQRGYRAA